MPLALRASFGPDDWRVGTGRCGPGARGATSAVWMMARRHAVAGLASDLTLHKSHGVPPIGAGWIRGLPHGVPASEPVVRSEPPASRGRLVRATTRAPGGAGTATVGPATTHPPDSHCETRPLRSRLRRPPRRSRGSSGLATRRRGGGRPGLLLDRDGARACLLGRAIRHHEAVKQLSAAGSQKLPCEHQRWSATTIPPATIGRSIDCARHDRLPSRSLMKE
jgi:hypothetical protein